MAWISQLSLSNDSSALLFVVFAGFPFLPVVWCFVLVLFPAVFFPAAVGCPVSLAFLLVLSLQLFQDLSGTCQDSTLSQVDFIIILNFHHQLPSDPHVCNFHRTS